MSLKRKQRKLLGFGPRWESADPTLALVREAEVQNALSSLLDVYEEQQQVQNESAAECSATYDPISRRALLTRRRGQVVESFGRRESGDWVLDPEEVLYLAERATLAVYVADGDKGPPANASIAACAGSAQASAALAADEGLPEPGRRGRNRSAGTPQGPRRLRMEEVYNLILGSGSCSNSSSSSSSNADVDLEGYSVYAHLRRAGFPATRRKGPLDDDPKAFIPLLDAEEQQRPQQLEQQARQRHRRCGSRCWSFRGRAEDFAEDVAMISEGGCSQHNAADSSLPRAVHIVGPDDAFLSFLGHMPPQASSGEFREGSREVFAVADARGGAPALLELGAVVRPGTVDVAASGNDGTCIAIDARSGSEDSAADCDVEHGFREASLATLPVPSTLLETGSFEKPCPFSLPPPVAHPSSEASAPVGADVSKRYRAMRQRVASVREDGHAAALNAYLRKAPVHEGKDAPLV